MSDDGSISSGDIAAATAAASGDAPAPAPVTESPSADSASAPATAAPASETPINGSLQPAAEPPKERWSDILANARTKAAEEALAPYAWAKSVDQQAFQRVLSLAQRASADPIGYLQEFIAEVQQDPTHGARLKTLAAKALAARGGPSTAPQEPPPDLVYQMPDGQTARLYSAEQQAKRDAFLQQQWMSAVEQKLQPLTQAHQTLQQREAAAVEQAQTQQFTARVTQDVKARPGVTDAAMKAMADLVSKDPSLPAQPSYEQLELAVERAYRQVVLPTYAYQARQTVLTDLHHQAAATTVNPAAPGTRAPKTIDQMSIAEALQAEHDRLARA